MLWMNAYMDPWGKESNQCFDVCFVNIMHYTLERLFMKIYRINIDTNCLNYISLDTDRSYTLLKNKMIEKKWGMWKEKRIASATKYFKFILQTMWIILLIIQAGDLFNNYKPSWISTYGIHVHVQRSK